MNLIKVVRHFRMTGMIDRTNDVFYTPVLDEKSKVVVRFDIVHHHLMTMNVITIHEDHHILLDDGVEVKHHHIGALNNRNFDH
ncbi:hypothetical protein BLA29_012599 [Euroglyphus maynei]|uniref:Uncharacterized protein n=1 Tax=Euroglyphus maynei TaxID=6958 RepID=A0A1Y3AV73_EURMA|nr:hypothetical protein BLA29_012599 [Euroglyphus maynei]